MQTTLGFVSDVHFGPDTPFEGKLRKLCHRAPDLLRDAVRALNDEVRADLVVNLGDDIEDVDAATDRANYGQCQEILRGVRGRLVNVAGNHDTINLSDRELNGFWQRDPASPLFYSFDHAGFHFAVLHTHEIKDSKVGLDDAQLHWLRGDLRSGSSPAVVLMHHSASEQDLSDSRWFARVPHLALLGNRREFRSLLEASGRVRAVFNGHVHRNHLDVINGIPYVTVQSMIENLDDDAPGRPAAAYAVATITPSRIVVRVRGNDPARYQFDVATG